MTTSLLCRLSSESILRKALFARSISANLGLNAHSVCANFGLIARSVRANLGLNAHSVRANFGLIARSVRANLGLIASSLVYSIIFLK